MYRRYLLFVVTLSIFLLGSTTAFADPPNPLGTSIESPVIGINGGLDPNHVFTPEEIQRMQKRDELAQQHYSKKNLGKYPGTEHPDSLGGKTLSVGYWPEPNDWAHRNYCGPASTQVALDARLPSWQVADLEVLAAEENINPAWGVTMNALCNALNNNLNTGWYGVWQANSSSQFYSWVVSDIDNGYALVTGVRTDNMPGWNHGADHIVTVHGYWEPSGSYQTVKYVETSSPTAGYSGPYYRSAERNTFFGYVAGNNAQCW